MEPIDQNQTPAPTIHVGGEDKRVAFHINPMRPIRARNPRLQVHVVDTVRGLEFPHIIQGCYPEGMPFKYTVDALGYRYANRRPSDFDIENTTRPNSFEPDAMCPGIAASPVPVPAAGADGGSREGRADDGDDGWDH